MTTASPIKKIHNIPIVVIKPLPKQLPEPNPSRLVPIDPIRVKEPVRK